MRTINLKTPAKINLILSVKGRRDDGFHNIESIMHSINLYDKLKIEILNCDEEFVITEKYFGQEINLQNSCKLLLSGNSDEIPYDCSNLVSKACDKFIQYTNLQNQKIHIQIDKKIPVCAGLAGGSTNASGTLLGLNKLFNNILNDKEINLICSELGSDLNFCLKGGACLCEGRGEIITPLKTTLNVPISLIRPKNLKISAKEAYTEYSKNPVYIQNNIKSVISSVENGDLKLEQCFNELETNLLDKYEILKFLKNENMLMTGSGPVCFTFAKNLKKHYDKNIFDIYENYKTIGTGIEYDEC